MNNRNTVLIILLVLIIVLAIVGIVLGIMFYRNKNADNSANKTDRNI